LKRKDSKFETLIAKFKNENSVSLDEKNTTRLKFLNNTSSSAQGTPLPANNSALQSSQHNQESLPMNQTRKTTKLPGIVQS
jgi:hypothetical protein